MIWTSLLLESTIKISLVVLIALAAVALARRQSAAVRHCVLATAILCAAAMPLLESIVPSWQVRATAFAAREGVDTSTELRTASATLPEASSTVSLSLQAVVEEDSDRTVGWGRLVTPIWMAGTGIAVSILLVGLARLAWLESRSRPLPPGTWTRLAEEVARDYGLRRPLRLLQSDHPTLLVTWGFVRPRVLLPRPAPDWAEDRIRVVLAHELAHIRRGDWIVQMAAELLRCAYWFNPLVWIACARLRHESEQACDDAVLRQGIDGPDYAEILLALARALKSDRTWASAPAIAHPSNLERRIAAMVNARVNRSPVSRSARLATAVALLSITAAVAAAQTESTIFSGSVLDSSGAPVPGVTLVVTSSRSDAKHEVQTDHAGYFEFVPLPSDDYLLEARFPGFARFQDTVRLTGPNMRRDITLELATLQETVKVAAGSGGAPRPPAGGLKEARSAPAREVVECTSSTTGGRVRPPWKLRDVRPHYPEGPRDAGISGPVLLQGRLGTDGTMKDLRVIESVDPDLANAALEAVWQWEFDETLLNCVPVEVDMSVTINFEIRP